MQSAFIRTASDGRKVEVIGPHVCVDGKPVADALLEVSALPNKRAILSSLPNAAYMAGPVVLTFEEGSHVRGALAAAGDAESDRIEIDRRFREVWNKRSRDGGIE